MIHALAESAPRIHVEAFVHPDATVIGAVTVGARSSIWPGVVLRADMGEIVIGQESSLQDGGVAHMTEGATHVHLGNRVTVGHRVILHGVTVEDECLIGMGAILLDHVVIGRGSLVGAGALVTAGTVVPPGSLVLGMPARVIRAVGDRERKMIETGWRSYLACTARYKTELGR